MSPERAIEFNIAVKYTDNSALLLLLLLLLPLLCSNRTLSIPG